MPGKYIRPAVMVAGTLMMWLGVYELAGWWGLLTATGATLLLYGALSLVDMRDLGQVLAHEGPLPYPSEDRPQ
jgi:hypothetical protein